MPAKDKTGPAGQGAQTGRGLGLCGGGQARMMGFGRGFGKCFQGFRQQERIELTKDEQRKILEAEKQEIEIKLKEL